MPLSVLAALRAWPSALVRPADTPRGRRLRAWAALLLSAACVALLIAWRLRAVHAAFAASLPALDGTIAPLALSAPVTVERDGLGIPTLTAANRPDLAFATGFVHAQDRFFQMDLLRRHPAGELAELFGPAAVEEDLRLRRHRFRHRARQRLLHLPSADRALLDAYVGGVEAGRASLAAPPWEYELLGLSPAPWTVEDTLLVVYTMFHMLQRDGFARESDRALARDRLPGPLAAFLQPAGSRWDAPLLGGPLPGPTVPGPGAIDVRQEPGRWKPMAPGEGAGRVPTGSNNFAVAGARTAHGGAIVANDMHLGLRVPIIWYRAAFDFADAAGRRHFVCGATLPGTPAMVVGSNRRIAWGFTNVEGDFSDLVELGPDPTHYTTPRGAEPFTVAAEVIRVRGEPDRTLEVRETVWGPVFDRDAAGGRRALRWIAHEPDAVNLELLHMETASSLEEALALAPRCGTPAQNLAVADDRGGIAWTVLGRLPRRVGFDGAAPVSWADGSRRWDGYLPAEEYPRLLRPADGVVWSANNRTAGEPWLSRLGKGTYDLGARARQIRDDLRGRDGLREGDLLAVQLDDRAVFLDRWQRLLVDSLPATSRLRREASAWGGRAAVDSVGFRVVRSFRTTVRGLVLSSLTAPCRKADPRFDVRSLNGNNEDSVWELVTRKPAHLLPPDFASWDGLLATAAARVEAALPPLDSPAAAWGAANTARIRHPLSGALGPAAGWLRLDMPADPLPGDSGGMPRVQTPTEGASQRMVVSPGREAEGIFHMPTGQSGHPLSPHYRDQHAAWVHGKAAPFLPGPPVHLLTLKP